MHLYPLTFSPRFKERVWGGRKIGQLYRKNLPDKVPIGESWEISDRPEDVSVIANGPLEGKDLRWLMEQCPAELLGAARAQSGRFPLLVKILDAREKLSLQVHPPAEKAAILQGEPKTEMWYVTEAERTAELYVGLKQGVTRRDFEAKVQNGRVADCFHRLPVQAGDAMFLPSGRVHAIGAGLVLFEIQQNSDTTYRVFDWNRVGLDGRPRQLHVAESLASIDFADFEPALAARDFREEGGVRRRLLVDDPLFKVEEWRSAAGAVWEAADLKLRILGVVQGEVVASDGNEALGLHGGEFGLLPACVHATVRMAPGTALLVVESGE
jgi:mannose-6-phosphate isomerase